MRADGQKLSRTQHRLRKSVRGRGVDIIEVCEQGSEVFIDILEDEAIVRPERRNNSDGHFHFIVFRQGPFGVLGVFLKPRNDHLNQAENIPQHSQNIK